MKSRVAKLLAVGMITIALAGCGGGIGTLLSLVDVGDVVAGIGAGLFRPGDPPAAQVYLDGQPITQIRAGDTQVRLADIPAGNHRLHVAISAHRGATSIVDVEPARSIQAPLTPFEGGRITGTVMLRAAGGATSPAVRTQVYSIPEGRQMLHDGGTVVLPGPIPPYAAYTDSTGAYDLRALEPGSHLVIAAVAGYMTDMQLVDISAGQTLTGISLTLQADPALVAGRVIGSVQDRVGTSVSDASVRANLRNAPYRPGVPQETVDRITSDAGLAQLPAFRFDVLSTLTALDGRYRLPLMSGTYKLHAFEFGLRPELREISIMADQPSNVDFRLVES